MAFSWRYLGNRERRKTCLVRLKQRSARTSILETPGFCGSRALPPTARTTLSRRTRARSRHLRPISRRHVLRCADTWAFLRYVNRAFHPLPRQAQLPGRLRWCTSCRARALRSREIQRHAAVPHAKHLSNPPAILGPPRRDLSPEPLKLTAVRAQHAHPTAPARCSSPRRVTPCCHYTYDNETSSTAAAGEDESGDSEKRGTTTLS